MGLLGCIPHLINSCHYVKHMSLCMESYQYHLNNCDQYNERFQLKEQRQSQSHLNERQSHLNEVYVFLDENESVRLIDRQVIVGGSPKADC